MSNIQILDENNFNDTISEGVTLVDFYADRCGPCKMLAPVIDELAEENSGKVKFGKLDVDRYIDIAMQYKIMNIPTIMVFKDGKLVDKVVGLTAKENLQEMIKKA